MVEDHIVQYRDSARVAFINKTLQVIGSSVGAFNGEWITGVVAPRNIAGKFRHGQQVNAIHAQRFQVIQLRDGIGVCSRRGAIWNPKCSNVHFIDNKFIPVCNLKIAVGPRV